jgi:hypothetical protein
MQELNKSRGFGDTIAKVTKATGLDKVAKTMAKAAGTSDCGCNDRRDTLNRAFPYKK